MASSEPPPHTTTATATSKEKRHRSVFELPANFFDSCAILTSSGLTLASTFDTSSTTNHSAASETLNDVVLDYDDKNAAVPTRWTCNTCKAEFESLQDQRFHFKSDIHRFNVKLSLAGKSIVKEEDFDELTSDSFRDFDVSSISGSEEDDEPETIGPYKISRASFRQKLFFHLPTGERVSIWKCLITNDSGPESKFSCNEMLERLNTVVREPRDNTCFRVVLLASGGHFAGCVFDGNKMVAHKTFHRYVVRAKSGKKQSSNDASGRAAHSAGASLRRHNEFALKKDIQELLAAWKPYFDASSCVFVYAPSSNHQLLSNGEKLYFSPQKVRNIPITIRRPTMKEARRIYDQLTQVSYEPVEIEAAQSSKEELPLSSGIQNDIISSIAKVNIVEPSTEASSSITELPTSSERVTEVKGLSTPLHEAAQSGNVVKVLELLEQGLDPCIRDERGQTPYMLANDKEVRNVFRRFMASNMDQWDWQAAKVPSPLTKEMEESQAAKQAEKDAKRKAKAKELKKLRKEKEKKAQAEAAAAAAKVTSTGTHSTSSSQPRHGSNSSKISKEEELKRAAVEEREKRAAAAERRMAAAAALSAQGNSNTEQPKSGVAGEINCSCCNVSLAGKVPFHRYNYKYCSTTCMHVHREFLEDDG